MFLHLVLLGRPIPNFASRPASPGVPEKANDRERNPEIEGLGATTGDWVSGYALF